MWPPAAPRYSPGLGSNPDLSFCLAVSRAIVASRISATTALRSASRCEAMRLTLSSSRLSFTRRACSTCAESGGGVDLKMPCELLLGSALASRHYVDRGLKDWVLSFSVSAGAVHEGRTIGWPRNDRRHDGCVRHAAPYSSQNIPWGLARGMFGATHGAELVGLPTSCRVSQCSTAFPSLSNR